MLGHLALYIHFARKAHVGQHIALGFDPRCHPGQHQPIRAKLKHGAFGHIQYFLTDLSGIDGVKGDVVRLLHELGARSIADHREFVSVFLFSGLLPKHKKVRLKHSLTKKSAF